MGDKEFLLFELWEMSFCSSRDWWLQMVKKKYLVFMFASRLRWYRVWQFFFFGFSCRRLVAFPKGYKADYLSLYLEVADFKSLPSGWRRYVKFRACIVNQLSQELSVQQGHSYLSLLITSWFVFFKVILIMFVCSWVV